MKLYHVFLFFLFVCLFVVLLLFVFLLFFCCSQPVPVTVELSPGKTSPALAALVLDQFGEMVNKSPLGALANRCKQGPQLATRRVPWFVCTSYLEQNQLATCQVNINISSFNLQPTTTQLYLRKRNGESWWVHMSNLGNDSKAGVASLCQLVDQQIRFRWSVVFADLSLAAIRTYFKRIVCLDSKILLCQRRWYAKCIKVQPVAMLVWFRDSWVALTSKAPLGWHQRKSWQGAGDGFLAHLGCSCGLLGNYAEFADCSPQPPRR